MRIVVDASSLASIFLPDEDSEKVEEYLDRAETVAAPNLAIVETAAAFYRRVRKGTLTVEQATMAATRWIDAAGAGGLTFYEDTPILEAACTTAGLLHHALQDCIYLELARKLGCTLLTSDRVFANKAAGVYAEVLIA